VEVDDTGNLCTTFRRRGENYAGTDGVG